MKKISLFFTLAILAVAIVSCGKSFKTTAKLNSELDSVNYALGVIYSSQMKQRIFYGETDSVKLNDFYKSFLSGFNANFKKMSEKELQKFEGMSAGLGLTSELKQGFFFGDSTLTVQKEKILNFALAVINGEENVGGFTAQTAQEFCAKIYYGKFDSVKPTMTPEKLDSLNAAFAVASASSYVKNLEPEKKSDFIKNFKAAFAITDNAKIYEGIGSLIAAQNYDFWDKNGLERDSTLKLHPEQFRAGINAGILTDTVMMSQQAASKYFGQIANAKRQIEMEKRQAEMAKQQAEMAKQYESNIEIGAKFLEENKSKPGVKVTESGLQYKVIKEGKGAKPTATDNVKVHYHGTLIDGTVFDSSVDRGEPISFPLNGVIAGWTEGVQLMSVGSKYKFFIPYTLAYGERGAGEAIKPYSTLIFEVELLGIEKAEKTEKE